MSNISPQRREVTLGPYLTEGGYPSEEDPQRTFFLGVDVRTK